jgi:glycosyltransferase involved in cell wall biosynthesis
MNLLYVSHEYPPIPSGGSYTLHKIVLRSILEHKVHVLIPDIRGAKPELNLTFHRTGARPSNSGKMDKIQVIRHLIDSIFLIRKIVKKHQIDAVFGFFSIPAGLSVLLAIPFKKVTKTVLFDAIDLPTNPKSPLGFVPGARVITRIIARNFNHVILVDGMQREFEVISDRKYFALHNGINIVNGATPRKLKDRTVFLTIARLVPRKRVDLLIEAFSKLSQIHSSIALTIVGDGPERGNLENLARQRLGQSYSDSISFMGFRSIEELETIYANSDVYVFSGLNEGSSMSMLDALAYGLPVIATDDDGNRLYVEHGKNGFLVDEMSLGFFNCMNEMLSNPDTYTEMSKNALDSAQRFSWDEVSEQYVTIITEKKY